MCAAALQAELDRADVAGLAAAPATLAAPPVHAETRIRWRLATSWPKNLPGPGIAAAHIARRVGELSGGRFEIQLFGAGEIVPALQVLDAVGNGTVEMGHSAAFFWQGKNPAANFFTTIPFGPDPVEHLAWLELGGGQALWDELYRPFGTKALIAGNTGPSMAGWFKREIGTLADVKGLKLRAPTRQTNKFLAALGATPVAMPVPQVGEALAKGVIDGAVVPYEVVPSVKIQELVKFHSETDPSEPAFYTSTFIFAMNQKKYDSLPADLKKVIDELQLSYNKARQAAITKELSEIVGGAAAV